MPREHRWLKAARERAERGTLEAELDLFERASQIRPLTAKEWLWVTCLLHAGGYTAVP